MNENIFTCSARKEIVKWKSIQVDCDTRIYVAINNLFKKILFYLEVQGNEIIYFIYFKQGNYLKPTFE